MKTIKYVAINTQNNEPMMESSSYTFLVKFLQKVTTDKKSIKIYKKIITVETEEMED
jgi:hypothetical protein